MIWQLAGHVKDTKNDELMKGVFLSLISNLIRFHTMGGSFVYLSRLFVLHNTVSTQCLASFFSDCCLSLLPSSNKTLTFTKSSLFSPVCLFLVPGVWRGGGRCRREQSKGFDSARHYSRRGKKGEKIIDITLEMEIKKRENRKRELGIHVLERR